MKNKKLTIIKKNLGRSLVRKNKEYHYIFITIDKKGNKYCIDGDTIK